MRQVKQNQIPKNEKTVTWLEDRSYSVSEFEHRQLLKLAHSLPSLKMSELNDAQLWCRIKDLSDDLPIGLRERLTQFSTFSNEHGFVILRRMPTDDQLPLTPLSDAAFANYDFNVFAKIMCLIAARTGFPRAYKDEKNGLLLQPIFPKPNDEYKQENSSSDIFLEEHTEDGFLREYCDFLMLGCLRSDHLQTARTGVAGAWRAAQLLAANVLDVLRQPRYVVESPTSFGQPGGDTQGLKSQPIPVLTGDLRRPNMVCDAAAMSGIDPTAQAALKQFIEALRAVHVSGVLLPGDILIVDNKTSVHTRSNFKARFDGADRWLLRLKMFVNPRSCSTERTGNSLTCGSIQFAM